MKIKIRNIMVDIINRCNLNCLHCYNRTYVNYNELMTLEQLTVVLSKLANYGTERIYLTGGEPLLHPQLFDMLYYITHTYPQVEVGITTNGLLLNESVIEKIVHCGNIVVQISIDGATAETYEAIRGRNTYASFIKGLETLKKSAIPKKTARTCISAINYQDVPAIYTECIESNIEPSFLFVSNMGNANNNWKSLSLTDAQKISVVDKINLLNKKYNGKISAPIPPYKCNFTQLLDKERGDLGEWGILVQTNGSTTCCQFLYDTPIGNIFKDSLETMFTGEVFSQLVIQAEKRKNQLCSKNPCKTCFIKDCGLGCMGLSLAEGDILGLDGQCKYRQIYATLKGCNLLN